MWVVGAISKPSMQVFTRALAKTPAPLSPASSRGAPQMTPEDLSPCAQPALCERNRACWGNDSGGKAVAYAGARADQISSSPYHVAGALSLSVGVIVRLLPVCRKHRRPCSLSFPILLVVCYCSRTLMTHRGHALCSGPNRRRAWSQSWATRRKRPLPSPLSGGDLSQSALGAA